MASRANVAAETVNTIPDQEPEIEPEVVEQATKPEVQEEATTKES